jgi:anti-sigma regulatory factor (Ser/Thr protein kinase)
VVSARHTVLPRAGRGLAHPALFYRTPDDFVTGTARFVRAGLDAGDAALVSIPGWRIEPLRAALGDAADRVRFADMTQVGRNPSCIIPFVQQFVDGHAGRRISFVGEPIWPGRSPAEVRECVRHEALLNAAFADAAISIFCPYDAAGLDAAIVADAWRTHPVIDHDGDWRPSSAYTDPGVLYAAADRPLPDPPPDALVMLYRGAELPLVRRLVEQRARQAGLTVDRADDLTTAVNEVVTNTLAHTGAGGALRIWWDADQDALVCEVRDSGHITDRLAGRRMPAADAERGRGLWLVNQLCDLVEIRSDERGNTIRLYAGR